MSTDAIAKATGVSCADWVTYLDGIGGRDQTHTALAAAVQQLLPQAIAGREWWAHAQQLTGIPDACDDLPGHVAGLLRCGRLPANSRVNDRGLDRHRGLALRGARTHKAGIPGATHHVSSPFFVWSNTSRMGTYLWAGEHFAQIEREFGRPSVQTWAVTSVQLGAPADNPASAAAPRMSWLPRLLFC